MLIGFCGCKGVGKDTAASFLIEQGYTKLAFADRLKQAVANLFDIPYRDVDSYKLSDRYSVALKDMSEYERHMTWRVFLQRFGTEMGRNTFGQDFWVQQWNDSYDALFVLDPDAARKVVVTDVRFPNEAIHIHFCGGHIIEIQRPGYVPDGHASEERLPADLIDTMIMNDGDLELFRSRVLGTLKGLSVGVV